VILEHLNWTPFRQNRARAAPATDELALGDVLVHTDLPFLLPKCR